jgi:hypothetical protein
VQDLIDPNRDVEQPEDSRIVDIVGRSSSDGSVYAAGMGNCNETLCHPVLFRSPDEGATWERLPAEGFSADTVLLPPSPGDTRIFAMGSDGLVVSEDGGGSFDPAAVGGGPHASGPAAMSPAFNDGDPSVLVGASTLLRYRDDRRTMEPVAGTSSPGPVEPAYSPSYRTDQTVFLGAVIIDPVQGTVSTVHRCVADVCSPVELPGQAVVPQIVVPADHEWSGRVFAFTDEALFVSSDRGATFVELARGWSGELWDLAVAGESLIASTLPAGGEGGVYISEDGGTTWRAANSPLLENGAATVSVVGDRVLVGLGLGGVACSTDGGATWARRCAA